MLTLIMYYSAGVKINLISRGNRSPSFGPRSANCNLIATVRTIAKFANILSAHSKNRIPRCKDIQTHKSTYIIRLIFPSPERSGAQPRATPHCGSDTIGSLGRARCSVGPRCWCGCGWSPAHPLIHSLLDSPPALCHALLHRPPR